MAAVIRWAGRRHLPRWGTAVLGALTLSTALVMSVTVGAVPSASAATPAVGLGTASSFAVLAGSTVTNTGPSIISGDLGVSPGSAVTGFPPGTVINGVVHAADAVAAQAQADLTTAYNDAAGRTRATPVLGDLGGQTLVAGVYNSATSLGLTGTVTLDAQGDPSAVFILQAGSTLITAPNSTVALINGAQSCNVFWQVGSSATVGVNTTFVGSILALTSASVQTGATVDGRVLARNGAVTLDTNTITTPTCMTPPPTTAPPTTAPPTTAPPTTAPPTTAPPTTAPPTTAPPTRGPVIIGVPVPIPWGGFPGSGGSGGGAGGGGAGGGGAGGGAGTGGGSGPGGGAGGGAGGGSEIPAGHPQTGEGGAATSPSPSPSVLLAVGLAALAGAGTAAGRGLSTRRRRLAVGSGPDDADPDDGERNGDE